MKPIRSLFGKLSRRISGDKGLRLIAFAESVLFSVTNFAIVVMIGRMFSVDQFAAYGIALSVVLTLQNVQRIALVTPMAVRSDRLFGRMAPAIIGAHVLTLGICIVTALVLMLAGLHWGWSQVFLLALSSGAILLLVYPNEIERVIFYKSGSHGRSLALSVATAVLVGACLAASHIWRWSFEFTMMALALTGLVKVAVACLVVRRASLSRGMRLILRNAGRFMVPVATQLSGTTLCAHGPLFVLALLSTSQAAAAYVAVRTVFQPIQVLLRSVELVDRSRFARDRQARPATALSAQLLVVLRIQTAFTLATCIAVALSGPWLLHWLFAGRFDGHMMTLWLWGAIIVVMNVVAVTDRFIAALALQARHGFTQMAGGFACLLACALLVPRLADAGAALAALLGWVIIATSGYWLIHRSERQG